MKPKRNEIKICLGKKPVKKDSRNLQMADILEVRRFPAEYDVDHVYGDMDNPMYTNDVNGCCVIAGRGHQTRRFELKEQKILINITDDEIVDEWHRENGNTDDGLYMLDSLRSWRKDGWVAGGKRYYIKAFAQVDPTNDAMVKYAIYKKIGVVVGMALPNTAIEEFREGKIWSDISEAPNQWNGHCVYIVGYTKTHVICITWGKRQLMTWDFFKSYTDECYGVIDARNITGFKVRVLEEFLESVSPVNTEKSKEPKEKKTKDKTIDDGTKKVVPKKSTSK